MRKNILLAIFLLAMLLPVPAIANVGLPVFFGVTVVMVVALIPVILLEGIFIKKIVKIGFKKALGISFLINTISTIAGAVLSNYTNGFFMYKILPESYLAAMPHMQTTPAKLLIGFFCMLIFVFIVTVFIEYFCLKVFIKNKNKRELVCVTLKINFISYLSIITVMLVGFIFLQFII